MEVYIAVEGEGTQSCWYTQATQHINAYLLEMEMMLAQVLIKERHKQEQASRARQAGKKAKQADQLPLPTAHIIETEEGQKQEQRLVISGSKKECCGKY